MKTNEKTFVDSNDTARVELQNKFKAEQKNGKAAMVQEDRKTEIYFGAYSVTDINQLSSGRSKPYI